LNEKCLNLEKQLSQYESKINEIKLFEEKELEFKNMSKDMTAQLLKAEKALKKQQDDTSDYKMEAEGLRSEIENIASAFEGQQEKISRLTKQLGEKDDAIVLLQNEKLKTVHIQNVLKDEKSTLDSKIQFLEGKIKKHEELQKKNMRKDKKRKRNLQINFGTKFRKMSLLLMI